MMKNILLFLFTVLSLSAFGQPRFFMINKTTGVEPSTPEYYFIDAADAYVDYSQSPTGWTTYNRSSEQLVASPATLSNLKKSNASQATSTATTVSFTYISGFTSPCTVGSPGSDAGVFDDNVLDRGWAATDGAQFKFSGIDNGKQYTIYILFSSLSWEGGVQYFSVGASNSGQKEQASNYGNHATYPNWEDDPALIKVTNITPTSNEITATIHTVSGGVPRLTAIILKQQ